MTFTRTNDFADAKVIFNSINGSILLDNQWWGEAGVEYFQFADGTVWNESEISRRYVLAQQSGGNDTIFGTYGDDTISGMDGDDTIYADAGNDLVVGGRGNDHIEGRDGADTYLYNVGDGDDYLLDLYGVRQNYLVFGAGIAEDDIVLSKSADFADVVISFKTFTGSILLDSQHWWEAGIDFVKFADGTIWNEAELDRRYVLAQETSGNDTIFATYGDDVIDGKDGDDTIYADNGNDTITGGKGDDRLEGRDGIDTYSYNLGDGNDQIYDIYGVRENTLVFGAGIAATDIVMSHASDFADILISFKNEDGSILLDNQHWWEAGIEYIKFDDGTVWNTAQITQRYMTDQSTSGNDLIWGTYDADVLAGGLGDDRLEGADGSDRYVYNVGDGNDVIFDYRGSR